MKEKKRKKRELKNALGTDSLVAVATEMRFEQPPPAAPFANKLSVAELTRNLGGSTGLTQFATSIKLAGPVTEAAKILVADDDDE
jgi:hypothetical protein